MQPAYLFILRFMKGLFLLLLLYTVASWGLFQVQPAWSNPWHGAIVGLFLLYGGGLVGLTAHFRRTHAAMTSWILLGGKIVKMALSVGLLLLYWQFSEASLVPFVVDLLLCYVVTMIYETAFFVRELKKHDK